MSKDKLVRYVSVWAISCWLALAAYCLGYMMVSGHTPPNAIQLIAALMVFAFLPFVLAIAWAML